MDITYRLSPHAVLLYFQDCFANYLTAHHLAAFDIIKNQLFWIITQFGVTFTGSRPIWSENITVEIWIRKITSVKVNVNFAIHNVASEIIAEGESTWAVMHTENRRPFNVQGLLKEKGIEILPNDVIQISIPAEGEEKLCKEVCHQVNLTDLDFNGHMCNRSYLNLALSTAPIEFIRSFSPKRIQIRFIREAFLGDDLLCRVFQTDNNRIVRHSMLQANGKEVCSIISEWETNQYEVQDISEYISR